MYAGCVRCGMYADSPLNALAHMRGLADLVLPFRSLAKRTSYKQKHRPARPLLQIIAHGRLVQVIVAVLADDHAGLGRAKCFWKQVREFLVRLFTPSPNGHAPPRLPPKPTVVPWHAATSRRSYSNLSMGTTGTATNPLAWEPLLETVRTVMS